MYRKAQKYLENKNFPSALQTLKKIANDIDDVWGVYAIYDLCCYCDELKISDKEKFQYVYKVANYYDFTEQFDEDSDVQTCWRYLLNAVGVSYYLGQGCQEDNPKAFEYFQKAANLGESIAMYFLGCCYRDGYGTPENHKNALLWFLKSKETGDDDDETNNNIHQLCNELGVPTSITSLSQYFSTNGTGIEQSSKMGKYVNIRPNEQEFVDLIKELTSQSILTIKKYSGLRRAGNRLNIDDDRRVELLNMAIDRY